MNEIRGNTVFVLGAGASAHTGAPLLFDFLVSARNLLRGPNELRQPDSFQRVFEWIDSLRASSYYVDLDLDNLEHVFSLLSMEVQIGVQGSDGRRRDLTNVIVETLEHRQALLWRANGFDDNKSYGEYVTTLRDLRERRNRRGLVDVGYDATITFNYDMMLDLSFHFKALPLTYGFSRSLADDAWPLYKLHGSVGWARCRNVDCKEGVVAMDLATGISRMKARQEQKHLSLSIGQLSGELRKQKCPSCDSLGLIDPQVIPPTWAKATGEIPALSAVWGNAVEAITRAVQIIVVGYSMPATDTFFRYLLTLGLRSNQSLQRIVIVDPNMSEQLSSRYSSVLSRSLESRGRLQFVRMSFEKLVQGRMINLCENADYLPEASL